MGNIEIFLIEIYFAQKKILKQEFIPIKNVFFFCTNNDNF